MVVREWKEERSSSTSSVSSAWATHVVLPASKPTGHAVFHVRCSVLSASAPTRHVVFHLRCSALSASAPTRHVVFHVRCSIPNHFHGPGWLYWMLAECYSILLLTDWLYIDLLAWATSILSPGWSYWMILPPIPQFWDRQFVYVIAM